MTIERDDVSTSPRPPSRAVLDRYHARLRPWRIAYAVGIAVVVIAAAIFARVAYSHGEISHARLHTVPTAAPSVALHAPSTALTQAWRSDDHTAIGTPYWGGTVVTFGEHTVRGRNAQTGAITWSYTRDDRTVCQAAQIQGVTVTVFRVNGNCDELTALDSGTGARKWTRTLDKDGHELNGTPSYAVTPFTLMLTTPSVIYAVEPNGGLDRWVFGQPGCTIRSAVLGTSGALISQDCAHPDCTDRKFCGPGEQLLLRDPNAGENEDSSSNKGNPDQVIWNLLGDARRPAAADDVVAAISIDATTLDTLDPGNGKPIAALHLAARAGGATVATDTAHAELLWTGGVTYAIVQSGRRFTWTARTLAAPTVTSTENDSPPDLTAAELAAAGREGIELLDPRDGRPSRTFAVASPSPRSRVYPYGTGFLVAGPSTVAYR